MAISNSRKTNISQGRVATCVRCGGIFNNHYNANLLVSLPIKNLKINSDLMELLP